MKIRIGVTNANPTFDLKTAAYSCKGKENYGSKPFDFDQWKKWLIAEHTPIETITISIILEEAEKSVVAQLVRHTDKHPRHFVQSSRPDLNDGKPRDPNALIRYTSYWNPQALILMMRKRLCSTAERKTRQTAALIKWEMMKSEDPLLRALGFCCVPNCVYRSGCCEPWSECGFDSTLLNVGIEKRYEAYNANFADMMKSLEIDQRR